MIKANTAEINGATHSNFLFTMKMTATVRAGIIPNIKIFIKSIIYLLKFRFVASIISQSIFGIKLQLVKMPELRAINMKGIRENPLP